MRVSYTHGLGPTYNYFVGFSVFTDPNAELKSHGENNGEKGPRKLVV